MAQAVGNYGGVPFGFTAGAWTATANFTPVSGTDTGPLLWKTFPWGKWKNFQFQSILAAGSTAQITAYGTLDVNTASGAATNWFALAAPATEAQPSWANPMTVAQPALYVVAGILCVRLVIAPGGTPGNGTVLVGVMP